MSLAHAAILMTIQQQYDYQQAKAMQRACDLVLCACIVLSFGAGVAVGAWIW